MNDPKRAISGPHLFDNGQHSIHPPFHIPTPPLDNRGQQPPWVSNADVVNGVTDGQSQSIEKAMHGHRHPLPLNDDHRLLHAPPTNPMTSTVCVTPCDPMCPTIVSWSIEQPLTLHTAIREPTKKIPRIPHRSAAQNFIEGFG